MKKLSVPSLIELLANTKFGVVSLEANTIPTDLLNKTNGERSAEKKVLCVDATGLDPANIRKNAKVVVFVGTEVSYEKLVNNRLAKELLGKDAELTVAEAHEKADFVSKGLPFGEMLDGTHIVHTPKDTTELRHYLRVYFVMNNKPIVKLSLADGSPLPDLKDAKFAPFKPKPKSEASSRQKDAGVEKVIEPRTYLWDNIANITLDGETYEVLH